MHVVKIGKYFLEFKFLYSLLYFCSPKSSAPLKKRIQSS